MLLQSSCSKQQQQQHQQVQQQSDPAGRYLHVNPAHMGVGGDDSWSPTVHDDYLLPPKKYCLGVELYAAAKQLQQAAAAAASVTST
jgi:hypothetical protein